MNIFDSIAKLENVTVVQLPVGIFDKETLKVLEYRDTKDNAKAFEILCRKFESLDEINVWFAAGVHALLSIDDYESGSYLVRSQRLDTYIRN